MIERHVRLGVLISSDAPFDVLRERWRDAEALGFDVLYTADHSQDFRETVGTWFDGWTVLAEMARTTSRARIGSLVSNPILRPPDLLAREAVAVDHLAGGRLEIGIGTGIAGFDHQAAGSPEWPARERQERFAEYVAVVDGLLRARERFTFSGHFHRTDHPPLTRAVQEPRPPITVGGGSPRVREVAVAHADAWNTHGPWVSDPVDQLDAIAAQNADVDRRCERTGRDPSSLRRSVLLFGPIDVWTGFPVERTLDRLRPGGFSEYVIMWPPDDRRADLDRLAERFGALRTS